MPFYWCWLCLKALQLPFPGPAGHVGQKQVPKDLESLAKKPPCQLAEVLSLDAQAVPERVGEAQMGRIEPPTWSAQGKQDSAS